MELMSYAVYKDQDGNITKTAEIADAAARRRISLLEANGGGTGGGGTGENPAAAASYAEAAAQSASQASASATAATNAKTAAEAARDAAQTAETNAAASKTAAANSATTASSAATTAGQKATAAANSASEAAESLRMTAYHTEHASNAAAAAQAAERNAADSASAAEGHAEDAASHAVDAGEAKDAAESAANTAKGHADTASSKATAANTSANTAASKATEATNAATSAASAKTAAETAQGAAEDAQEAAETAASTATSKASAASTSASNAKTSETNAANSATAANTSKNLAAGEASAAGASATTANNKANEAAASASAAAASATAAQQAADSLGGGVPDYVLTEAERVAAVVQGHQGANTVTFLACSDIHFSTVNNAAQMKETLTHISQGMKAIRERVAVDFAACLGDSIWDASNETVENVQDAMREVNAALFPAFNGVPNFRLVGNHEAHYNGSTKLTNAQIFANTAAFNAGATFDEANRAGGYCYRDFDERKLRVVCLNTSEGDTAGGYTMSAAQLEWLANVLDLAEKGEGWRSVILSHIPLDWYGSTSAPLAAVKAASGVLCNVHGHIHNYLTGTLEGTSIPRFGIPNGCFYRANEYGQNSGTEYNGMEFGETTTYNKTAGTANDTAFCVVTIDLDGLVAYADHYGAGYDREITLPGEVVGGYTNLVPTAQAIDSTDPYNGTGYKNGYYLSSSSPFEGTDSTTVLTGCIPYSVPETGLPPTIYIKGAEWRSISHCRWFGFDSTKTATKGCQIQGSGSGAAALTSSFTVTQLGDDYFSLEPILDGSAWAMIKLSAGSVCIEFFRVSLVGTGENLIITLDEPIED